jgi:hypothetical protein
MRTENSYLTHLNQGILRSDFEKLTELEKNEMCPGYRSKRDQIKRLPAKLIFLLYVILTFIEFLLLLIHSIPPWIPKLIGLLIAIPIGMLIICMGESRYRRIEQAAVRKYLSIN